MGPNGFSYVVPLMSSVSPLPGTPFPAPISLHIWQQKYRFEAQTPEIQTPEVQPLEAPAPGTSQPKSGKRARGNTATSDQNLDDTFARVAKAAAGVEKGGKKVRAKWARRFQDAMTDFGFLPAGRILAGAGTERDVTLFNCFVMGTIEDDLGAIFDSVREAALTMQQGGGIGQDFSTLRPKGALVKSIGADASGPVSFMDCSGPSRPTGRARCDSTPAHELSSVPTDHPPMSAPRSRRRAPFPASSGP